MDIALIQSSCYEIKQIDNKNCIGIKRSKNAWSRKLLQKECKNLDRRTPCWLKKQEYAKLLVVLRGIKALEYIVLKKLYGVRCKTCSICKERLRPPIFRHNKIGYHLKCIVNWLTIAHKFSDPITFEKYTDTELKTIDKTCELYSVTQSNVFDLKYDITRIYEDQEMIEHEERIEILSDIIDSDFETYRVLSQFPGIIPHFIAIHFQRTVFELAQLDSNIAREQIIALLSTVEEVYQHRLKLFLMDILDQLPIWEESRALIRPLFLFDLFD